MPFPDGTFNLVTGVSVMTHLNAEMEGAWLRELQRITAPGALLFLSISGATQFAFLGLPAALYAQIQQDGFIDSARDGALDGHIANPEYYRSTWHSRAHVRTKWGSYFDVVAFLDGVAALQDFVVLRRRAS